MKVFLNYEAIPFYLVDEEELQTKFLFTVPNGYSANIPFSLDNEILFENGTYALTVGIFVNPNTNLGTLEEQAVREIWSSGLDMLVMSFDVLVGDGGEIALSAEPAKPQTYFEDLQHHSVLFTHNDEFDFPEQLIQVAPGETVELVWWANLFTNEYVAIENYAIIAMLDWEQLEFNGQPYLLVSRDDPNFSYQTDQGVWQFEAPLEPGLYDFAAFMVPNATQLRSIDTFFFLETASRLTIEVVE